MNEILGVQYLNTKECSQRYGYSIQWFIKARLEGFGPPFIQVKGHGRVLYNLENTDKWFKEKMKEKE